MGSTDSGEALVVIDVQDGFISDYTKRALPRVYELLEDERFGLVIATRFYNPEGSPFRKYMRWDKLAGTPDTVLDPVVAAKADIILDKPTYGAGEAIARALDDYGIRKATLVGIDTDVCVLQNAAYLFDHDYEVTVDTGACATNGGPEAERAAIRLLGRTIGRDYVLGYGGTSP